MEHKDSRVEEALELLSRVEHKVANNIPLNEEEMQVYRDIQAVERLIPESAVSEGW